MFQSKPNFLARIARAVERLLVDEEMKKRVRMRERERRGGGGGCADCRVEL